MAPALAIVQVRTEKAVSILTLALSGFVLTAPLQPITGYRCGLIRVLATRSFLTPTPPSAVLLITPRRFSRPAAAARVWPNPRGFLTRLPASAVFRRFIRSTRSRRTLYTIYLGTKTRTELSENSWGVTNCQGRSLWDLAVRINRSKLSELMIHT